MCGIAGILIQKNEPRRLAEPLLRMIDAMKQRGPDDYGFTIGSAYDESNLIAYGSKDNSADSPPLPSLDLRHQDTARGIAGTLFIAHRRLSIIDVSSMGHQPMSSLDGRYWITFNGEIYNYKDIAAELTAQGVHLVGQSDTEVLLQAYIRWGPKCLDRLNGMFAFAIWDQKRRCFFCARDRLGIKPFYYTMCDGLFLFASDIKTLIASGLYRPAVSIEGLYHVMSLGVAPRPITAFQGVYGLRPGHFMEIRPETHDPAQQQYWRVPVGTQKANMSENEAVELVRNQLTTSVRRNLVADVDVGTFMSGGIDSTTVSAIAAIEHPSITAFTLGAKSENSSPDDVRGARNTAAMYSMNHVTEIVEVESALHHLEEMILVQEEPCYALPPDYVLSKVTSEYGFKVVLSGLGGDELFGGYIYYNNWLPKWQMLKKVPFASKLAGLMGRNGARIAAALELSTADRFAVSANSIRTEAEKKKLFMDSDVKDMNSIERIHELYVGDDVEFTDDVEAISYIDLLHYVGNHQLYRLDQSGMAFSVESRFPLLDHEMVEAAFSIPTRHKIRDGIGKHVLRRVAQKLVAPECLSMPKQGFSLPTEDWMRGQLSHVVDSAITKLADRGIFQPDEVMRSYNSFKAGKMSYLPVWQLVTVELWHELMIEGRAPVNRVA